MTEKTLKKIEGTIYKTILEHQKKMRKRFLESELENDAKCAQIFIAGYVQALCDCGVVTARERQVLFIYYGTM